MDVFETRDTQVTGSWRRSEPGPDISPVLLREPAQVVLGRSKHRCSTICAVQMITGIT